MMGMRKCNRKIHIQHHEAKYVSLLSTERLLDSGLEFFQDRSNLYTFQ